MLQIITNNHERQFLYGYELPESVHPDFDYMDNINDGTFFKYRGCYYSLDQFMRNEGIDGFDGWDGYHSDSFFSGVLIAVSDDGETYKVGTYIS